MADPRTSFTDSDLVTPATAAAYLGGEKPLHTNTLCNWRLQNTGPRFVKLGGKSIRYRIGDLKAFLSASTETSHP